MSRSAAREKAFSLIFEYLFLSEQNDFTMENLSDSNELTDADRDYIRKVYTGVIENYDKLVGVISLCAAGFSIDRIFRVDLSLLLLAAYEIYFIPDIPRSVSCNEVVNLAKVFSTDKSPAYINGVLAGIIKKLDDSGTTA
ncbi:MAG: transcription antitermination factor NusB [Clostridiales bacterium]|jgi:N utilization substance protein B|nr:transcription antitermination factor NusB [Clostridiales bacterium]